MGPANRVGGPMGVLADFIVATEADASEYDGSAKIPDSHRAQHKRLTEVELGTLYHITQGKPVDDDTLYDFNVIRVVDDGEQLTTELLPDLIVRLAAASNDDLDGWAEVWSETDELSCDADDVRPILDDLRRLSRLAAAERKSVYLWNCV